MQFDSPERGRPPLDPSLQKELAFKTEKNVELYQRIFYLESQLKKVIGLVEASEEGVDGGPGEMLDGGGPRRGRSRVELMRLRRELETGVGPVTSSGMEEGVLRSKNFLDQDVASSDGNIFEPAARVGADSTAQEFYPLSIFPRIMRGNSNPRRKSVGVTCLWGQLAGRGGWIVQIGIKFTCPRRWSGMALWTCDVGGDRMGRG